MSAILDAKCPEDIFGDLPDDDAAVEARKRYRELARTCHPDVGGDPAEFRRLNEMWAACLNAIVGGHYGERKPLMAETLIRTKRHAYRLDSLAARGDACNVYAATIDDEDWAMIKVARDAKDNDLVKNEAQTLKHLLSEADPIVKPFLPQYIETFGFRQGGSKKAHQSIVSGFPEGLYSLEQVRERYPKGVHPKDAAWMLRRLLFTLGFVHDTGTLHGAVLPSHVLIHPEEHGLVLIDWKYATDEEDTIKAISGRYRGAYAPEVLAKEPAVTGTDIFTAARCMVYVLGGDINTGDLPESVPVGLRRFFKGCTLPSKRRRPQTAHHLLGHFDELLEAMWGPRRYRPFTMKGA